MDISFLWSNDLINVSVIAWVSAQLIKAVVDTVKHKQFDRHRLAGAGGMPSSHSAVTCAVLLPSYYLYGFNSSTFALAFVVALIVMYDATGVRWAAGLHARAINQLVEYLNNSEDQENKNALAELIPRLNESLGHRVIEVICGALLGFAIAFIAHLIRQGGVFLF